MAVPETSIHKDDLAVLREHDVRIAREITAMDPKAVSHHVKD